MYSLNPIKDMPLPLDTKNAKGFVDPELRLVYQSYHDIVTPDVTRVMYQWIGNGMHWFNVNAFRGSIFDFREVTQFTVGNNPVAIKSSKSINENLDTTIYPVVMVVDSIQQEIKVRLSLMGEPAARKFICRTNETALEFINEWNKQSGRHFDESIDFSAWPTKRQQTDPLIF